MSDKMYETALLDLIKQNEKKPARSGCALRSSCANAPREQLRECTAKPRRACVDGQLARRSRERVGWTGIRGEEGAWDVLSCALHLSASVPAACILVCVCVCGLSLSLSLTS